MDSGGPHSDEYNACFRDVMWLQQFPLTHQTAIHYFSLSQFYDRTCNNEKLKMQRLELDRLKTMRGIEYESLPPHSSQQPQRLYLIRKQRRFSTSQVKVLGLYYILDGSIYQAPNLYSIVCSRLMKCSFRVNESFKKLVKGVRFGPTEGYGWDFEEDSGHRRPIPSEQMALKLRKKKEEQEQVKRQNSAKIESILVGLLKKYVPDVLQIPNANEVKKNDLAPSNDAAVDSVRPPKKPRSN